MKRFKTAVLVSLTACLLISAACAQETAGTPAGESPAAADQPAPAANQAVEGAADEVPGTTAEAADAGQTEPFFIVSNTTVPGYPENDADNISIQEIEKQSGYKFRVEAYSGDDYFTKLQLYISSGDLPDMWYATKVDDALLWKEQEVIMPLTGLYNEYGADMKQYIYDDALNAFKFDGEYWAIPSMYNKNSPGSEPAQSGPIVRMDWLEKLGIPVPETLDQYHDMLVAFTENDPDGNGKKDTYGLGMSNAVLSSSFNIVYNAYGIDPKYWTERDGKIVKGFMTDEFTQAVTLLRDWYAEGIIDPEFPVMSGDNMAEKSVNSIIGLMYSDAWKQDSVEVNEKALKEISPDGELTMIAPAEGPEGKRGNPAPLASFRSFVFSVTCEQPELLMQFCNWFALGEENWMLSEHGVRGVQWDWDANNAFVRIPPYDTADARYQEGWSNCTRIQTMVDRRSQTKEVLDAISICNKYTIGNAFWGSVPAMNDYPDIEKDVEETTMKVVLGELPVEELDAMKARYYERGGSEIESQINTIWESMK